MSTRFLTDEDLERINKALSELNKKIENFEPDIDDSDIKGGYYIPSIDEDGNLSWIPSEEGMPAIEDSNIKGPRGTAGISATHRWNGTSLTISSASGSSSRDLKGKSAYEYAIEGGFIGTEEEFSAKLAALLQ